MEYYKKEIKRVLQQKEIGKRELRQAEILKIIREMTEYVYNLFLLGKISQKQLGEHIKDGEADFTLIKYWRKNKEKRICCILCIRKGKKCICRKVSGIICTNCLCDGKCQ